MVVYHRNPLFIFSHRLHFTSAILVVMKGRTGYGTMVFPPVYVVKVRSWLECLLVLPHSGRRGAQRLASFCDVERAAGSGLVMFCMNLGAVDATMNSRQSLLYVM